MNALWSPSIPVAHLLLRAGVVYLFVLALLRLSGKRQIGQMGPAEFVALLLVSNAVQNAMNGGDNSITAGLVLASTLLVLSGLVGWLAYRYRRFDELVRGRPVLLVYKGEVVEKNLKANLVSVHELHELLRHQGFHELKGLHEVVLESNGALSVVKSSDVVESPHS